MSELTKLKTATVADRAGDHARTATALAARGDFSNAAEHFEAAVRLEPEVAQFRFQLGVCRWGQGRAEAETELRQAVQLDPNFAVAHAALSAWHLQHGTVERADESSHRAYLLAPDDHGVVHARATVLEVFGQIDTAWEMTARAVQTGAPQAALVRLHGRLASHRDRSDQLAALSLVENHLADANRAAIDRARLHFTAAELLDRLCRYDEAFAHASAGNRLAARPYRPEAHQRSFDLLIEYFTPGKIASLAKATDRADTPVFIVGMPRSGTSLVEQILASHPDVHGGGELNFMAQVWAGTIGMIPASLAQYPACLDRLTVDKADGMSQIYLQPLMAINPAAARITDKLPLNFLHLGLIALLMPGARVIDCRRDPRDTCLSCFLSLFAGGNEFKYDLDHTAHFLGQYRRLMEHWERSLNLPILQVQYETLVTEPERQTRRMVEFLGLPWDARCLNFACNPRPVTSSSRQQVRQRIYQSSVGRWRNYATHLGSLQRRFGNG